VSTEVVDQPLASSAAPTGGERLPLSIKLAYGLPNMAGAGMGIGVGIHINIYYSDSVLLPLGFIAAAIAAARSIDALTDPLMGWISDRTKTRWGRRIPWMFVAAPLAAITLVCLFTPPEGMDTRSAATWFAVSYALLFLFITMYNIPHYGLGPELTSDYKERSSLFAWMEGATLLGIISASYIPLTLAKESVLGPRNGFMVFAIGFGALLWILYWVQCVKIVERPEFYQRESNPLIPGVRRTLRNRPFRILLISYLIGATTAGISGLLWPYFATYVLKLTGGQQGILLASIFVWGFASIPIWVWTTRRWGKKWNYVCARLMGAASALGMFFMREGDLLPAARLRRLHDARAVDPGGRHRLRRVPHGKAARSAVRRSLGRHDQVHDGARCRHPARDHCQRRVPAERRADRHGHHDDHDALRSRPGGHRDTVDRRLPAVPDQ
jgi:GPH family glycoside/pentoside/hexuronide:cation symporter